MKILFIFMFFGYASASLLESFKRETRGAVNAFGDGLQRAIPLHEALGIEDSPELQRIERDVKDELKQHIKDVFEKALKRIEDANERGETINQEALKMLKDLREKMKDLDIDDETVKDGIDELKMKIDAHLRSILEKMGIIDKRFAETDAFESMISELSMRDMFIKLKNMILEKMNVGSVKQAMVKLVGQGSQKLCEWITSKGKEKVLSIFDRILASDEESEVDKRNTDDRVQEIKHYLQKVEEHAEQKLQKLKSWLQDLIQKGLHEAKERLEKTSEIIKEVFNRSKYLSRSGFVEILDYLRMYEQEFSSVSDLRSLIEKILN